MAKTRKDLEDIADAFESLLKYGSQHHERDRGESDFDFLMRCIRLGSPYARYSPYQTQG